MDVGKKDILYKIKKIGELMGEKSVFRIGVDKKEKRLDLLSVYVCDLEEDKKAIAELPDDSDYIG